MDLIFIKLVSLSKRIGNPGKELNYWGRTGTRLGYSWSGKYVWIGEVHSIVGGSDLDIEQIDGENWKIFIPDQPIL